MSEIPAGFDELITVAVISVDQFDFVPGQDSLSRRVKLQALPYSPIIYASALVRKP
jgi:hypothetical protein